MKYTLYIDEDGNPTVAKGDDGIQMIVGSAEGIEISKEEVKVILGDKIDDNQIT